MKFFKEMLTENSLKDNIKLFPLAIGVIFFWRGVWAGLDRWFLPDSPNLSIVLCTLLGFGILMFYKYKNF